jgi:hypothetical protein
MLELGNNFASKPTPGIVWQARVTIPAGCDGELKFVQNITSFRRKVFPDQSDICWYTPDYAFYLDGSDPYGEIYPAPGGQTVKIGQGDGPGLNVEGTAETIADEEFEVFVMFRPNGGNWKTLGILPWYWGGNVEGSSPYATCADYTTTSAGNSVNPSGSASERQPVLQPSIGELTWRSCDEYPH